MAQPNQPAWDELAVLHQLLEEYLNTSSKIILIGSVIGKVMKIAFPANLASPKAQNVIVPSKLDDPSCQIPNSSWGLFLSILKFAYFWYFYIGKKKSLTLWSEIICHVTLRVVQGVP